MSTAKELADHFLVGLLRDKQEHGYVTADGRCIRDTLYGQAADRITELEAENERLREAMLLISGYATVVRMAKVARAALNPQPVGEKM